MDKDYRRLWNSAANTIDKARAIRTLAEILADEEGRAFVSRLELKEAELCIELLGLASHDLLSFLHHLMVSSGYREAHPRNRRKGRFHRRVEETCRILWTTSTLYDDSR